MSDTQFPPTQAETSAPPMSLGERLTNIFVSPGEVFDDIKRRPHDPVNWLVPALACIIVGIVFTFVVFSQPQIIQGIHEAQEKQFQQMVDKGVYSRQQADQMMAAAEKFSGPTALKIFGTFGTLFAVCIQFALMALLIWAIGSLVFKGFFSYGKAMEVVGLTAMIGVVDTIIKMLLAAIYSNPAMSPGPVLLIGAHYDPNNHLHMVLAWMDIFVFWQIGLWSLGLARLSGHSFIKSLAWLGACLLAIGGTCFGALTFMSHMLAGLGGHK